MPKRSHNLGQNQGKLLSEVLMYSNSEHKMAENIAVFIPTNLECKMIYNKSLSRVPKHHTLTKIRGKDCSYKRIFYFTQWLWLFLIKTIHTTYNGIYSLFFFKYEDRNRKEIKKAWQQTEHKYRTIHLPKSEDTKSNSNCIAADCGGNDINATDNRET